MYHLIGKDGKPYDSETPGTLGGHRKLKIYGRLDCPSALRYIAKGQYVAHRGLLRRRGNRHRGRLPSLRQVHARGIPPLEGTAGITTA